MEKDASQTGADLQCAFNRVLNVMKPPFLSMKAVLNSGPSTASARAMMRTVRLIARTSVSASRCNSHLFGTTLLKRRMATTLRGSQSRSQSSCSMSIASSDRLRPSAGSAGPPGVLYTAGVSSVIVYDQHSLLPRLGETGAGTIFRHHERLAHDTAAPMVHHNNSNNSNNSRP